MSLALSAPSTSSAIRLAAVAGPVLVLLVALRGGG